MRCINDWFWEQSGCCVWLLLWTRTYLMDVGRVVSGRNPQNAKICGGGDRCKLGHTPPVIGS